MDGYLTSLGNECSLLFVAGRLCALSEAGTAFRDWFQVCLHDGWLPNVLFDLEHCELIGEYFDRFQTTGSFVKLKDELDFDSWNRIFLSLIRFRSFF